MVAVIVAVITSPLSYWYGQANLRTEFKPYVTIAPFKFPDTQTYYKYEQTDDNVDFNYLFQIENSSPNGIARNIDVHLWVNEKDVTDNILAENLLGNLTLGPMKTQFYYYQPSMRKDAPQNIEALKSLHSKNGIKLRLKFVLTYESDIVENIRYQTEQVYHVWQNSGLLLSSSEREVER